MHIPPWLRFSRPKRERRAPTPVELQEHLEKRREYQRTRAQKLERKHASRDTAKRRRQPSTELGKCIDCSQQAIPDETRCPSCAEKHRQAHKNATAERRAANAAHTSQRYAECDYIDAANRRSQASFLCPSCGHEANADENAAEIIRHLGLSDAQTKPANPLGVPPETRWVNKREAVGRQADPRCTPELAPHSKN